jgi:hypothetical protein
LQVHVKRGGERDAGRRKHAGAPDRRLGGRRYLLPGVERVQLAGGEPGDRIFHHDSFGVLEERVTLSDRLLVAGDQRHRRLAAERDQRVDAAFPAFDAVELHLRHHRRVVSVRQHRALAGYRPVVADEEHSVHGLVHALHHVQRLVPSGDVRGAAVQVRRVEVVHLPVRVVAHDLRRAARQRPVDGRVDLAEQQRPSLFVRLARRGALRPVDDPRDALHVKGNEYLHGLHTPPPRRAVPEIKFCAQRLSGASSRSHQELSWQSAD